MTEAEPNIPSMTPGLKERPSYHEPMITSSNVSTTEALAGVIAEQRMEIRRHRLALSVIAKRPPDQYDVRQFAFDSLYHTRDDKAYP